jgi:hypothetical protein
MATVHLFQILDGINSSDFADFILSDVLHVQNYAEACGQSITQEQAKRIQKVGLYWSNEQKSGNGEWSRLRYEAIEDLES